MLSVTSRAVGASKASSWTPLYLRFFTVSSRLCKTYAELDVETRRAYLDKNAARKRARYHTDPEFRAKEYQRLKDFHNVLKHDEAYGLRHTLTNWIRRCPWIRKGLPWKAYQPVYYNERVEHYCTGCGWTRRNGLKLWWVKNTGVSDSSQTSDSREHLCCSCYSQRGWSEAMPTGYEDIKRFKELLERKKKLDKASSDPSTKV